MRSPCRLRLSSCKNVFEKLVTPSPSARLEPTGGRFWRGSQTLTKRLLDAASERWRRFNGHDLVSDVVNDVKFRDGIQVTEGDTTATDEQVA